MDAASGIDAGSGGGQGTTATEAVRRLESLSRADVAYAGGKGANLGELTAAGLPVPGGFVVGPRPTPSSATAAACDRVSRRASRR